MSIGTEPKLWLLLERKSESSTFSTDIGRNTDVVMSANEQECHNILFNHIGFDKKMGKALEITILRYILECKPPSEEYVSIGGRFYHQIGSDLNYEESKKICENHGSQLLQLFEPEDLKILQHFGMLTDFRKEFQP